jgi:hypothetical protein
MFNDALISQKSDHWSTPAATKAELYGEFGLNFDPCPLKSSDDGLKIKWSGRVFCNPPYSRIAEFLKKGLYHLAHGDCELLLYLIPARTDTAWFHDYCAKGEIRFLRGRLKFGNAKFSAPFPSMVVVFREWAIEALPLEAA